MTKVLIVDDDKTTVMLLKTLLELDGFEIGTVGNGGGVMAMVDSFSPDVILMDYNLSDMKGIDVLREIRAHSDHSEIPIVMASGLDVGTEVLDAGANRFLIKPFEPDDLPEMFNELVG